MDTTKIFCEMTPLITIESKEMASVVEMDVSKNWSKAMYIFNQEVFTTTVTSYRGSLFTCNESLTKVQFGCVLCHRDSHENIEREKWFMSISSIFFVLVLVMYYVQNLHFFQLRKYVILQLDYGKIPLYDGKKNMGLK